MSHSGSLPNLYCTLGRESGSGFGATSAFYDH